MSVLYERLVEVAAERPDAPFVIEAETRRTLTYGQALAAVHATHQLFGEDTRCLAMALPNGVANAVIWLSALAGGRTLVPVSPDAPDAERARCAARRERGRHRSALQPHPLLGVGRAARRHLGQRRPYHPRYAAANGAAAHAAGPAAVRAHG